MAIGLALGVGHFPNSPQCCGGGVGTKWVVCVVSPSESASRSAEGKERMNEKNDIDWAKHDLAKGDNLLPEYFPELRNLSAAWLNRFVPRPQVTT